MKEVSNETIGKVVEELAFQARVSINKLCAEAGIARETITRIIGNSERSVRDVTIFKLMEASKRLRDSKNDDIIKIRKVISKYGRDYSKRKG